MTVETDVPDEQLAGTATRAFAWSFLNAALSRLGTLVVGVALARVLGPTEFGTFAVAVVALLAVLSFNELGVSLAIVRWEGDPRSIAPTVNTISVATSMLLFAAMYVAAPAVATALGDASASGIIRLMAASIVISGAVAVPAAMLQREFRQRRRLVIDQLVTWVGAGVSLGLAFGGLGAWSLAWGRVVGTSLGLVLFLAAASQPYRFGFDRAKAVQLLRFGLPLAGASVIVFAVGYLEQITVGAALGATALGFYVLAFNLASWPVNVFSHPLRSVAPAVFSRMQDDPARMEQSFRAIVTILAAVTLPVCLVVAGAAPAVVEFVYGDEWARAGAVLRFLALLAALRIFFELTYDYLVVCRRTSQLLLVQVVWLVCLAPTLWYAATRHGLAAVAAGQLVLVAVLVLPIYLILLKGAGVHASAVFRAVVVPLLVSGAAATAVAAVLTTVSSALLGCVVAGLVCLATTALLVLPHRGAVREVMASRQAPVGSTP